MLAGGGLVLLVAVQTQRQQWSLPVALPLGAGIGAWLLALVLMPPPVQISYELSTQQRPVRWLLLTLALGLAVATWRATHGGVYTTTNVALWIATVAAWLAAWWPRQGVDHPVFVRHWRDRLPTWLALLAIIGVGVFFRYYRLFEVPADPTSDHAEKLLDVLDVVNGERPIFFPRNTGREPGQFYITFALMRLLNLPLQWTTLKWGTALIGVLAIPAVFLFVREIAGRNVGLLAAALFAVSKWPVNTARMGLRFPYGPLPTALTLWLLFRYLRRGDRRDALLCGLVIGLGLHGYISFRVVPLLVPLLFGLALIVDRRWRTRWRTLIVDGALIAGTALLTCLPLAHYSVLHPDQVWYRVATRASSTERTLGDYGELLLIFVRNNWNALLAFNWRGDSTIVNAVQYDPFLDFVTGAALIAGVLIVGFLLWRDRRYVLILAALPVLLLPSTLSLAFPIENPSANRLGPVMPIIFLIAALPLGYLLQSAWQAGTTQTRRIFVRIGTIGVLMIALATATQQNFVRYFHDYDLQYRSYVPNTHDIARTIQTWEQRGVRLDHVYLLAFPYWLDGRNIAFALGDIGWQAEHDLTSEMALPAPADGEPLLFVLHPDDAERQAQLRTRFPNGRYQVIEAAPPGKNYALYFVPAP